MSSGKRLLPVAVFNESKQLLLLSAQSGHIAAITSLSEGFFEIQEQQHSGTVKSTHFMKVDNTVDILWQGDRLCPFFDTVRLVKCPLTAANNSDLITAFLDFQYLRLHAEDYIIFTNSKWHIAFFNAQNKR